MIYDNQGESMLAAQLRIARVLNDPTRFLAAINGDNPAIPAKLNWINLFNSIEMAAVLCLPQGNRRSAFQLPTNPAPIMAPNRMSVSRVIPRHMTMLPGGGSLARAR